MPNDATLAPAAETAELAPSERILQAAKELIALKGPIATTVRDICDASSVNVASVNYYFGSKDSLVETVLLSILKPVNVERRKLLEDARLRFAPHPIPVPAILEAMFRPMVMSERGSDGGRLFIRIQNHLHATPGNQYTRFVAHHMNDYAQIFIDAMAESLPHFTRAELIWRYESVRGSGMHLLSHCDPLSEKFQVLTGKDSMIDLENDTLVLRELIVSALLGLSAPPAWNDGDMR